MLVTTRAVVLHSSEYGESGLIVHVYTASNGMQSLLVNSVRKSKPRFSYNLFRPLSIVEIVFYRKKGGGLQRLKEIGSMPMMHALHSDVVKSAVALFLSEVLYRSVREEESNEHLFEFMVHAIEMLNVHEGAVSNFHLSFMIQLTRYLGIYPGNRFSNREKYFDLQEGRFHDSLPTLHPYVLTPETGFLLNELMNLSLEESFLWKINASSRQSLLQALVLYFELQVTGGNRIRAHEILSEVF